MHRSQVMLKDEHYRFLVDEAKRRGQTISAILRDWIDQRMHRRQQRPLAQDPIWDMVGIAQGGRSKISEDHDQYLVGKRLGRMATRTRKQR